MAVVAADTLAGMTTKKPAQPDPPRRGRKPTGRTPTVMISLRVSPRLADALEEYRQSLRPTPTQNAVGETALEDFLTAKGFWPPPSSTPPPDQE